MINLDKSMQIALNSEDSNSLMNKLKIKIQSSNGFQIKDRNYLYKTYKNCFIGYEAVDWLYSNCPNMSTRDDAIKLGQSLLDNNIIFNVAGNETIFKDDYIFYEFESNRLNNSITSSSSKSTTSLSNSSKQSSSSIKSSNISISSSNKNRLSTSIDKLNGRRTSSVPPPVANGSSTPSNNGSNSSSGGSSPNTSTTPTSSTTTSYNSNSYNKKHHRYSINDLSKVVLEDLNTVTLVKDELIQLSQELMHGDKGLKLQKKKKGAAGNTILCFSGSQLVDWLVKKLEVTRKESIQIASAIMHLNIFIEVGSVFNTNVMSATLSTTIPSSISLGSISNTSTSTSVIDLNYFAPPIPSIPITVNPLSMSSSMSSPLSLSTSSIPAFDNRIVEDSSEVFFEFLTKPEAIINHVAMKKLDDLCLAHKQISIIPTTIINTSKYLKILDLSFNQLSDTNQLETIATLYNLESCNLSHNQLSSIPSSFNRLELLSKLNLSHNCFTTIPTVVYQITSLEEFSIAANQLTGISESIGQLRSLERLDFKNNKLTKIPKEIGLLSRLKTLNVLYNNKISELPPFLSTLPMLEQLEFSIDTVKSPPKEITARGFIHIIGYLKDLFEGTETLPHIKLMVLGSEKTGKSTLIKALSKSTTKSLSRQSANFLKKVTSPEIYINESIEITQLKLDLPAGITINTNGNDSGNGNGMTHSLSSLSLSTGLLPTLPPTSTTTTPVTDTKPPRKDSFNSTPEKKRSSTMASVKKNIKLMIYDFKMQSLDVYYHTHQFFLSERAFYLITYDINKDLKHSNIDYWVDSIKKKAPHAPIYIVATHIDTFNQYGGDIMVPLGEVENYLNQRYLEVSGVIGISSTTLRNIDLLKNEIVVTLLNQQQHQQSQQSKMNLNQTLSTNWLNERIPSIYITLETNLKEEAKKRPIVTWDEYQTLAKLSNFTNTATSYEKLIRATNTLNRWGSIIWFEDSKSSLKDFVILDPQWFSDCFSKLLLSKHQYINSDGILLLINLKNIWKPNIVPEQFHIKLLKLLERYQILYTLKNNSNLLNNQSTSNSSTSTTTPNSANSSPSLSSTESSLNSMSYSLESRSISSPLPTVLLSAEISTNGNGSSSGASLLSSSSTSAFTNSGQPTPIKNSLKNSIRSINGSSSTSFTLSFNRIIIPCLLPVAKPSHLQDLWDTWSGEDEQQIGRYYQFKNSPKNYFDRLMVRFLYMMEPIVYWSSGILFRKTPGGSKDSNMSSCGTLVEFDVATQQLQIRVRGHEFEACAKLFQIVLENVDTILKDCQIDQLETYIPCSCNSSCRDLPHLHTIDLIEETFSRGESHIRCPVSKKLVCLGTVSPDITLSSVSSNKKILKEDLIYQEEVGIGGFAKVFKGIYKNTTVAIKQLNFERMDLIDSTSFNNLNNSVNSNNGGNGMVSSSSNNSLNSLSLSTSMLPPQQPIVNNNNNNKMYINNNITTTTLTSSTSNSSNLSQSTNKIQRNLSTSSLSSNSSQEDYNSYNQIGGGGGSGGGKLNAINEFRREVWLMSGLSHSNIVLMKGFCFEPYSIVMEYMDLGSLSSFLKNKKESGLTSLPWNTLMKIAIDIASGMQFLHNITPPLVHRDLKSPNILLASSNPGDHDSNDSNDIVAKVSDFGLSMSVVQNFTSSTRLVDNPKWLAPEVLRKMEYNEKSDIYSFAMIMWELYHLELPFDEFDFKFMSLLEDNILNGLRPSISSHCNQHYANLITKCWENDPNQRPSFNTILKTLNEIKSATSI